MTDWSTLKKLIWLRIIKGGGSALRTVTGAIVHVTNALAMPAKALSVNVSPIQDLRGYDNPWPAGGGKNKFDVDKMVNTSGITISNGVITVTGNAQNSTKKLGELADLTVGETYTLTATYTATQNFIYLYGSNSSWYFGTNRTITQSDLDSLVFLYGGVDTTSTISNFMIRLSSVTDATFSPYSNICPISGRTSATVTRTGANVWDEQWELGGIAGGTGLPFSATDRIRSKNFCPCKGNTAYYLKNTTNATALIVWWYDANQTFISSGGTDLGQSKVETSPSNARYFKISSYGGNYASYDDDFSVNYPSTDHDYHSYQGNTYTIQLGDTVYGGTLDVTQGKMTVDRAYKLLNDADKWITIEGTVTYRYNEEISRKLYDNSYTGLTCTIAPTISNANYTARWQGSNTYYFGIADKATTPVTSLDAIKAMATAGQIAICYAIEPVEITLSPTQIDMLLGENNLWADVGDSTLTYYAEGEASTSEALGILLGGTYNNPGGADDVSDDEALGILLGGS